MSNYSWWELFLTPTPPPSGITFPNSLNNPTKGIGKGDDAFSWVDMEEAGNCTGSESSVESKPK